MGETQREQRQGEKLNLLCTLVSSEAKKYIAGAYIIRSKPRALAHCLYLQGFALAQSHMLALSHHGEGKLLQPRALSPNLPQRSELRQCPVQYTQMRICRPGNINILGHSNQALPHHSMVSPSTHLKPKEKAKKQHSGTLGRLRAIRQFTVYSA